ncbi:MAG: glycosyl hydrolase family 8 [Cytophagaceae bacterium]
MCCFLNTLCFAQTAQINTPTGAKVPFNNNTSYAFGIMPTNLPTAGTYTRSQDAANAYTTWVTNYVRSCGGSPVQYRVLYDDGTSTVSEGIGYGMLIAAYAADQTMFNGLYAYYRANGDNAPGSGTYKLMNWHIGGCSGVSGSNAATDADEDVAMALVVAACQWPTATTPYNYTTEATNIIKAIMSCEIDTKTTPANQVSNGDAWISCNTASGNTCRNPSYMGPGYYKQFGAFVPAQSAQWTNVVNASYTLLNANRNATTGLVSSWCDQNGTPNNCNNTGETYYGYDACRNPWRMATDMIWYNDANASSICNKLATYINGVGAANVKGPVTQTGGAAGSQAHNATFVSTFAAGIVGATPAATYQTIMNSMYTQTVATTDATPAYFGNTLRVISLFMMSGNFWKPCPTTSPVRLLSFNATPEDQDILLSWETASELNNDYFSIERSEDGENYTEISRVKGAGNSNAVLNYSFRDRTLLPTMVYYRMKQQDADGTAEYSNVVSVSPSEHGSLSIVPNPFSHETTLRITGWEKEKISIEVIDLTGKIIFRANELQDNSLNIGSDFAPGMYVVRLLVNGNAYYSKMVKN